MIEYFFTIIGDSVNSVLNWCIIIISIVMLVCLTIIIAHSKIFDEYDNANDNDIKQIRYTFKWLVYSFIILSIVLLVKAFTPATSDMIIYNGLTNLKTDKPLYEYPISLQYLKVKFPEIYGELTENDSKVYYKYSNVKKTLDNYKDSVILLNKKIDSLYNIIHYPDNK